MKDTLIIPPKDQDLQGQARLFPQDKLFWHLVHEARETVNLSTPIRRSYLKGYKWGWLDREVER